ncbi:MAG: zinc ribbon domain-containing protein, partial [Chamaesiphon sp.]|nr:zinc ribbon domain-containing protein [Chamaesiphon sp.]
QTLTVKSRFDSAGIGRVVPESICKVWGKSNGGERSSSIPVVKLRWLLLMLVPVEYLEAICRGTPVETVSQLKFCARCWTPGTAPTSMWMVARSKFCFLCGSGLRERCRHCSEPIASLKHRFCPFCGTT